MLYVVNIVGDMEIASKRHVDTNKKVSEFKSTELVAAVERRRMLSQQKITFPLVV
jgi:hypothetical protein